MLLVSSIKMQTLNFKTLSIQGSAVLSDKIVCDAKQI